MADWQATEEQISEWRRQAIERAEREHGELHRLAKGVAASIGHGWCYVEGKRQEDGDGGLSRIANIDHGSGMVVYLEMNHKGRVVVNGRVSKELKPYLRSYSDLPEITCALEKGPEGIGRDIANRVIPKMHPILEKCQEAKKREESARKNLCREAAEFQALAGDLMEVWQDKAGELLVMDYRGNGDNVRVTVGRGSVAIDGSISHKHKAAVVAFVKVLKRMHDTNGEVGK